MNYIQELQKTVQSKNDEIKAIQDEINDFISFLHSPKFIGEEIINGSKERKDWIATGDTINRLIEIRNLCQVCGNKEIVD